MKKILEQLKAHTHNNMKMKKLFQFLFMHFQISKATTKYSSKLRRKLSVKAKVSKLNFVLFIKNKIYIETKHIIEIYYIKKAMPPKFFFKMQK
jgi:hypothetical protein